MAGKPAGSSGATAGSPGRRPGHRPGHRRAISRDTSRATSGATARTEAGTRMGPRPGRQWIELGHPPRHPPGQQKGGRSHAPGGPRPPPDTSHPRHARHEHRTHDFPVGGCRSPDLGFALERDLHTSPCCEVPPHLAVALEEQNQTARDSKAVEPSEALLAAGPSDPSKDLDHRHRARGGGGHLTSPGQRHLRDAKVRSMVMTMLQPVSLRHLVASRILRRLAGWGRGSMDGGHSLAHSRWGSTRRLRWEASRRGFQSLIALADCALDGTNGTDSSVHLPETLDSDGRDDDACGGCSDLSVTRGSGTDELLGGAWPYALSRALSAPALALTSAMSRRAP